MRFDRERMENMLMDYLYGELEPAAKEAFEAQLSLHPDLEQEVREHREVKSWLVETQEAKGEPLEPHRLEQIISSALAEGLPPASETPSFSKKGFGQRLMEWIHTPQLAMAFLVTVVAGIGLYQLDNDAVISMSDTPKDDAGQLVEIAFVKERGESKVSEGDEPLEALRTSKPPSENKVEAEGVAKPEPTVETADSNVARLSPKKKAKSHSKRMTGEVVNKAATSIGKKRKKDVGTADAAPKDEVVSSTTDSATGQEPPGKKFYDFSDAVIDGEMKPSTTLRSEANQKVKADRILGLRKSFQNKERKPRYDRMEKTDASGLEQTAQESFGAPAPRIGGLSSAPRGAIATRKSEEQKLNVQAKQDQPAPIAPPAVEREVGPSVAAPVEANSVEPGTAKPVPPAAAAKIEVAEMTEDALEEGRNEVVSDSETRRLEALRKIRLRLEAREKIRGGDLERGLEELERLILERNEHSGKTLVSGIQLLLSFEKVREAGALMALAEQTANPHASWKSSLEFARVLMRGGKK